MQEDCAKRRYLLLYKYAKQDFYACMHGLTLWADNCYSIHRLPHRLNLAEPDTGENLL